MEDVTESVPRVIPATEAGESSMETNVKTATFDVKTGIMSDGTKVKNNLKVNFFLAGPKFRTAPQAADDQLAN